MTGRRHATVLPLAIAAAIWLALLALLWPGVVTYDGMEQYAQALAGRYDDWHPPVMAALWSLLARIGARGSGPIVALQLAMLWGGLGLIATALARTGARIGAAIALASGLFPILASWMDGALKDAQLIGAMVLATGIVAWFRLKRRRLPTWAIAATALLLAYAALLRANAVFAVVPLAFGLGGPLVGRGIVGRVLLMLIATAAAIALSGPVNHRLLGAEASHVERTLPLFDMAGIAHRVRAPTLPGLPPAMWREAERRHCYTPFFWDPFADARKCGPIGTALAFDRDEDAPSIMRQWLAMAAMHPQTYAAHRIAHLNDTLRIAVPASERLAALPARSLPNPHRIGLPDRTAAARLTALATALATTPAGVPAVWLVLAIGLAWTLAAAPAQPTREIGVALAVSAVLMTASFAMVSIASDLRYHLWLFAATMLAAAMLAGSRGIDRRRLRVTVVTTVVAAIVSVILRSGLLPIAVIPT